MSQHSFDKLQELFSTKGFVPNNYFTIGGKYRLVELISAENAISLIVDLGVKYSIPSKDLSKHEYVLLPKVPTGDFMSNISINESDIRSTYREIDQVAVALESEEKLMDLYDKPISLILEDNRVDEKLASTFRQLKRFRMCFRNIPYKIGLVDSDCICLINESNELECYQIQKYPFKKRKMYFIASITTFFKSSKISDDLNAITIQFHDILNSNQLVEVQKVQKMLALKHNFVRQSERAMTIKKKLLKDILDGQKKHQEIADGMINIQTELRSLDPKLTDRQARLKVEYDALDASRSSIIKKLLDMRKQLDEVCLTVDNVCFDNALMFSKIFSNFSVMEKLK
jgi:hypothetical protein